MTDGTWSDDMGDVVTVAPITGVGDYETYTYGTQVEYDCRYETDAVRYYSEKSEVVAYKDLLITHTAVDATDTVRGGWAEVGIWPPGADTNETTEARKPSRVRRIEDLDGGDTIFEIEL